MSFSKYFKEETASADIAQATGKLDLSKHPKDCKCKECKAKEQLEESPVGSVGRTGTADAKVHVTSELRAEFKKIVKKLGGKTVARQLLAEMNAGGPITEGAECGAAQAAVHKLSTVTKSNRLRAACEDLLDLLDTDC